MRTTGALDTSPLKETPVFLSYFFYSTNNVQGCIARNVQQRKRKENHRVSASPGTIRPPILIQRFPSSLWYMGVRFLLRSLCCFQTSPKVMVTT